MTYNPTTHLAQLEAEARRKALASPGCPQAERSASFVMDETPTTTWQHTKALDVIALYAPFMEKMALFNPSWTEGKRPAVKGFAYTLSDASRAQHEQIIGLSREAAIKVLNGWNPPSVPEKPIVGDPFEGLVEERKPHDYSAHKLPAFPYVPGGVR